MKHHKLFKIALMPLLLICFLSVGYSQAVETKIAEYPIGAYEANYVYYPNVVHPSSTSTVSAIYQTFKSNFDGANLTKIEIYLLKTGSPIGVLRCALYSVTGTYGTTSTPDQLIETSSTDFSMATAQATGSLIPFTFAGTTQLTAGTPYAWVLYESSETTADTSNHVKIGDDTNGAGASSDGNMGYYSSSGYSSSPTNYETIYTVTGEGGEAVSYAGGNLYVTNNTLTNEIAIDSTNEFYDTQVTAEGGTGTTTATPINYYNSAAIILLSIICIALTVKPSVPILNFCFGIITFGIAAATAGQTEMLLYGYIQILAIIMAVICMLSGYNSWKR